MWQTMSKENCHVILPNDAMGMVALNAKCGWKIEPILGVNAVDAICWKVLIFSTTTKLDILGFIVRGLNSSRRVLKGL
jgi:hypothetical protein